MFLPPMKKVTSSINLVVTVVVTTWKNISKVSRKNRSACSENLEKLFDDRSKKPTKKYFSAIRQHLLDNAECAKNYKNESFSVLMRTENSFQLHILEALCTQYLRPSLCKQKKFVYQTRIFKSLY